MADTTVVDKYPKATNTEPSVQAVAQNHINNGAKSSVVTDGGTDWVLTTVWPGS
jgi:hypothetical protein